MEGCVVIPLITLVLTYSFYVAIGWSLLGLLGIERQIHMMTLTQEIEMVAIAIIGVVAVCYFLLSYLSSFAKQKRDATALQVKATNGYVLSIDEQVDIKKAETFHLVYKIAILIGIALAGVITSLAMIYIFPDYLSSSAQIYGASFVASLVICVLLDKTVIETTANGQFEKVKAKIYEEFRKIDEKLDETVNADEIAKSVSIAVADAVAKALAGKH